jgi:hypothetical protein
MKLDLWRGYALVKPVQIEISPDFLIFFGQFIPFLGGWLLIYFK